jgi:hypothetical protein
MPQIREGHDFVGYEENSMTHPDSASPRELLKAISEAFEHARD